MGSEQQGRKNLEEKVAQMRQVISPAQEALQQEQKTSDLLRPQLEKSDKVRHFYIIKLKLHLISGVSVLNLEVKQKVPSNNNHDHNRPSLYNLEGEPDHLLYTSPPFQLSVTSLLYLKISVCAVWIG